MQMHMEQIKQNIYEGSLSKGMRHLNGVYAHVGRTQVAASEKLLADARIFR